MDQLELGYKAVDDVTPSLKELVDELSIFPNIKSDSELIQTLKKWLEKMKGMQASDELDDDDLRQIKHDINQSFDNFKNVLN